MFERSDMLERSEHGFTLSRRSFLKASAIMGAAAAVGFGSEPSKALAEGADPTAGQRKRIRSCCRACGKVECGVWVTVEDNKVIKVEGDESSAHSRGHCCAKSQSSMLALYHPDRLRYCLKRTNPKGEDDPGWVRISLGEAFDEAGAKFNEIVAKYGGQANFGMCGTSRVYSMAPYTCLKSVFPTPNAHLAYEICKGPRHFAGVLTDELGSPWMEVEQGPLVYVQWGTAAEYSNYDSTNRTVVDCSQRAYKHILVDPRMTPLGKEADIWLPVRVGSDLAMSLGWIKWIIDNEAYDDLYVRRWSNAPFLWNSAEGGRTLKGWVLDAQGGIDLESRLITEADCDPDWINQYWDYEGRYQRFICWDENNNKPTYWDCEACQWEGERHKIPTTGTWVEHPYKPLMADSWLPDPSHFADPADPAYDAYWNEGNEGGKKSNPLGLPKNPALFPGGVEIKLKDGSSVTAGTVWESFAESLEDYTLENVSKITEVPADKIEEAVRTYTTRLNPLYGNGGIHFQLAPDQTGHGLQNSRALQIISNLTGNGDGPAGNRASTKSQVDGQPGRANMRKTDYSQSYEGWAEHPASQWGMNVGSMHLGDTPRNLTVEQQIPLIQEFVQHLIDEKSPLAERYGNRVPTDEEAKWIAWRKGGDYKHVEVWPNPVTIFEQNKNQISADRFPLLRYWNRWVDSAAIWDSINSIDSPYQIHGGLCMSGDFMNESNLLEAWEALTRLDFWLDFNLWYCPNNGCADIIIPVLHWLEANTTRVSQGAGGIFGAGQRCVEPMGSCIYDPVISVCMYRAMGVVWNQTDPNYDEWLNLDYHDFVQNGGSIGYDEQEYRVLGAALQGWKTPEFPDGPDFPEYAKKFQEEGWFDARTYHPERWGTYRRYEMGYRRQLGGHELHGLTDEKCGFATPTAHWEIWSTAAETYIPDGTITFKGIQDYIVTNPKVPDIDKFPHWVEPKNSPISKPEYYEASLVDRIDVDDAYINENYMGSNLLEEYKETLKQYPDNAFWMTTGSRQPVYFHSEHRQLPWCRELWPSPRLEINPNDAARLGLEQGDWIWVRSPWGAVREVVDLYYGIKEGTINANHGWWYPEFDTASHGFELVNINCLNDKYAQCWVCGGSQMRGIPAIIYKATPENCKVATGFESVVPCDPNGVPAISNANDPRLKEWLSHDPRLDDATMELSFASKNAKGFQHSIQDPGYYSEGTLKSGSVGGDALGEYSNKGSLSDKLGSYK